MLSIDSKAPPFRAKGLLRESLARDVDLAERDLFEFQGSNCDAVVASVPGQLGVRDPLL